MDESLHESQPDDEWSKAYAVTSKRRAILRGLIIDCSAQQIRGKQLRKDFDDEIKQFDRYLNKYQNYVTFKEDHPYAGSHPDFENEKTPVTVLDHAINKMKCYLPDQ